MVPAMEANLQEVSPDKLWRVWLSGSKPHEPISQNPPLSVYLLPSNYLAAFPDWFAHL